MTAPAVAAKRRPFFHERDGRRLYFLHFPTAAAPRRGGAVCFPPFGEEMNRSRRMAALLGEALAARGVETLIFDPSGTGDSAGEFADALWEDWRDDGAAATAWLAERTGGPVAAVGVRTGAALALDCARSESGSIRRLVLWQPVPSGRVFLTQILRLRLAAAMNDPARQETTKELRTRLALGETVEVAGYELTAEMADALETIRLADTPPPDGCPVHWIEVAGAPETPASPAGRGTIERWRAGGAAVTETVVAGPQFWAIQEITTAPALIEATVRAIADDGS